MKIGESVERRSVILLALFPPIAIGLLNELYLQRLYAIDATLYWAADVTQFVVVPVLLAVFLWKAVRVTPRELGLVRISPHHGAVENAALILFVCFMYWLSYEPIRRIAYRVLWPYAATFGHQSVLPAAGVARFVVVSYLAITAAVVEEIVFRSLPWLYLSQFKGMASKVPVYVLSTSLVFAAIHSEQGPHGVIAAFSCGIVAAAIYARIQNLWPLIAGHFVSDFVSFW